MAPALGESRDPASQPGSTRPVLPQRDATETLQAADCAPGMERKACPGEAVLHIHCVAGPEAWADGLMQIQTGSVDCAVEVQVVGQQTPVKAETEIPVEAPRRQRSRLRYCALTLLVLGLLATGVLVPVAVTVGFKQDIPPMYRVLQPPQPSYKLVFAFEASLIASTPTSVLPNHISDRITSWAALPTSGVHVAGFSSVQAMQQALAHLAAAATVKPSRRLSSDIATTTITSSSSSWTLKYAISDFRLSSDRRVTQVVDPIQLFDLAKQPSRQLLQQAQQEDVAPKPPSEAVVAAANSTSSPTPTSQDAAEQKGAPHRQLAALQQWRHAAVQQVVLKGQAAAKPAGSAAAELLPSQWQLAAHGTSLLPPAAATAVPATQQLSKHRSPLAAPTTSSRSTPKDGVLVRSLLQAISSAVPVHPRPQLQVQQRQAQQQVQRGGSKVAWHLADDGLGIISAWNTTSGLDRVTVAVIDSGVELASSGAGASVWANAAEVAGDGVDNDGNGYVDDAMGWDFGGACGDLGCTFCTPGPDPTDAVGWGTHAASVIAGQPEVASGTAGIAPGVRVMPLKVADCRHGTQLWDVATQQGRLNDGSSDSSSSRNGAEPSRAGRSQVEGLTAGADDVGPVLLGSAAVQAFDYALLNGAHIVLAGWSAGPLLHGSGIGQCYLGPMAAAQQGVAAAVAEGGDGCVDAVQRALFADVLQPLQQAGVLLVTMQGSGNTTERATGTSAAVERPSLPCSLSCELDNVLCVSASSTVLPPANAQSGLVDVGSAAEFFAPLTNQHSSSFYEWLDSSSSGSAGSGTSDYGDDVGAADYADSNQDDAAVNGRSAAVSDAVNVAASSCRASNSRGQDAGTQLTAPGTDILAGWAWGSHALVAGNAAAASVAAGVAALAWSQLGQGLGAEASLGAFEGLGVQVKELMLQGRGTSSRGSTSNSLRAVVVPQQTNSTSGAAATDDATTSGAKLVGSTTSAASVLELDLLGTLQQTSKPASVVVLQPSVLSPALTTACRALRYTWHIQGEGSGAFDTNAMWYVARRVLKLPVFPLTHWEFVGSTSLVELAGYIEVTKSGVYDFAVSSEDRFVLWLQDWWLHMQAADAASLGLAPDASTARVNFTAPGLYQLRLIIYAPSKPFNLQWKLPGSGSFNSITSFLSLGQTQPMPQQLLQTMLLPMSAKARDNEQSAPRTSTLSPKPNSAPSSQPEKAASDAGNSDSQAFVAASSSTAVDSPSPLPASPGGNADDGTGTSSTSSTSTSTSTSTTTAEGAPMTSSSETSPDAELDGDGLDESSSSASMEPSERSDDGLELELAEDAAADAAAMGSSNSDSSYAPDSGYQLRSGYTPYAAGSNGGQPGSVGGGFDNFLSSLRSIFGGGWPGRRRSSHRRVLLSTTSATTTSNGRGTAVGATPGVAALRASGHQRHLLASAGERVVSAQSRQDGPGQGGGTWGRFSLALSFVERTHYRTLMPDLTKLVFTHTGILPGPELKLGGWLQLQQAVLGYSDPEDNRGAYGMVQGWLSWADLNPAAAPAPAAPSMSVGSSSSSSSSPIPTSRSGVSVSTEGAGLAASVGGVLVGSAGVQFELACDACSLHVDGMAVAGSLGPAETSTCITAAALINPSATASSRSSKDALQYHQQQLMHLQILFTTNDVRNTKISVRSRPCNGLSSMGGSGAWQPLVAADPNPPAFAVASAAVSTQASSGGLGAYERGMLCSVSVQVPPAAASAARPQGNGSSSSSLLPRMVFLPATKMQETITIRVNATAENILGSSLSAAMPTPPANDTAANSSSSSPLSGSTVDVPSGYSGEGDSRREAASSPADSMAASNSSNSTGETSHAYQAAVQAEMRRRAARTAAAKAASQAQGISISDLAPDWVATLPAETQYSFSCGCYWNGSWAGNVSVGVSQNGGSNARARLSLAGWPVAAKSSHVYGPSDLDVRGYSTLMQRQQLAAGSDSADPLVDLAPAWTIATGSAVSSSDSSGVLAAAGGSGQARVTTGGSSDSAAAGVMAAEVIRRLRHARLQQLGVGRSSASGGGSSVSGLLPVGSVDGVSRRVVMPRARQHQLLVLQGEGLTARGQVVVLAPGDISDSISLTTHPGNSASTSDADSTTASSGNSGSDADGRVAITSSWLPGPWESWVPTS